MLPTWLTIGLLLFFFFFCFNLRFLECYHAKRSNPMQFWSVNRILKVLFRKCMKSKLPGILWVQEQFWPNVICSQAILLCGNICFFKHYLCNFARNGKSKLFFSRFFSSILAEAPRPCESTECCGPPTTSSGTSWNRQGVMMAASQSLLSILMLRLLFLVPCLRQL